MDFFQNTVINKYLKSLDKQVIDKAYAKFCDHFHNPAVQDNIRNLKEEEYQEGFLNDLFVKVLGYRKNPTPNYNLKLENKNVNDARKADGAIIINDVIKAVIELKGTDTTDLGKVADQAFGYKNNQRGCEYVIISNFEKLRFYIDNAVDHIEFNLFTLTQKEFELLYLCLSWENIECEIPRKIKEESISQEDITTKKLYNDYSLFKRELHQNLVLLNPQYDPLTLFKKSQKLLDRFLFLFFAEDSQLLPPNSVRSVVLDPWTKLKELDEYKPLYDRFMKYFGYLNTGYKGKNYDVFAYNGGLFRPDDILDNLKIDDQLLYEHTFKLSGYDFASEVDVNILGHIFENSLNELDEITARLQGQEIDKSKTKRKKDGVFYTPKYITKYIVDNTIGKLCKEKKAELQILEEEYITNKKRPKKTTLELDDKLTTYRNWLLQLTVCDPACGSGAFLNQALNFLITEHRNVDEMQAKLSGASIIFSDIEKSILENNLFGVDLNEESVEIAKLSLWLRTAQPNRKLNDLNNNIKCGNSLIDDPEVAGDKAFNWEKEFPHIFEKGGFNIVIGNPPYTYRNAISDIEKEYFKKNYLSNEGNFDLYKFFIEKIKDLTTNYGYSSLIVPNTFLSALTYEKLRKIIVTEFEIIELFDLGLDVFENVVVESVIFTFRKNKSNTQITTIKIDRQRTGKFFSLESSYVIDLLKYYNKDNTFNIYLSTDVESIISKSQEDTVELGTLTYCTVGINTGYIKDELTSSQQINSQYHKMLNGKNIGRNFVEWDGEWIMYDVDFVKSKGDRGRSLPPEYIFTNEKILVQRTRRGMKRKLVCYFDYEQYYNLNRISNIVLKNNCCNLKYIYILLNSELLDFYFNKYFNEYEVKPAHLAKLPIKVISTEKQIPFIEKADLILSLNKELQIVALKFQRTIQRKFDLDDLPGKLQNWYFLTYPEFITELVKKKIKLSLTNEAEWESYFLQESKIALDLKSRIEATDKEIDQMVYALYELTNEEIKIVEE
jgi:type I restriction-modification system DNA methylase subunit